MSRSLRRTALLFVLLAVGSAPAITGDEDEGIILKFSTVGDSRQDPAAPDPTTLPLSGQDAIWLQNTKAFSRVMEEIHHQKSDLFFFNGDMIMGYGKASVPSDTSTVNAIVTSDLVKFYQQYAFWRGMIAPLMEKGTYVVPVPGNHETQWKAGGKKAQVENENAWRANMADLILDDGRFMNLFGGAPSSENTADNRSFDSLATDQSKLSYSFDFRGSHFAIINTDPVGKDAHAPTNWLAFDLAAAQARGVRRSFVFGHKPAFTYYYGADPLHPLPATPSGLDNDVAARDAFWDVIVQYEAVYICGHEHIFHISRHENASGAGAWQILVGSGGSPFEASPTAATVNPQSDRDYAWATLRIHRSGRVQLTAYGFDDQYGQTRILQTLTIP